MFNIVHYRNGCVTCEHEVAVHRVNEEVWRNSELGGGETLSYYSAAVDPSCAGWVPEGSGVGVDVLWECE